MSDELMTKVQDLIENMINPAVAGHGGFVQLVDVKDNKVYLQMGGGCQGCGAADVTLKQGIERLIKEEIPGDGGSARHHRSRLGREPLLHALEVGPARPSPCPLPSGERVSCLYPPVPPERVRVSGSLGSLSPLGRRPG